MCITPPLETPELSSGHRLRAIRKFSFQRDVTPPRYNGPPLHTHSSSRHTRPETESSFSEVNSSWSLQQRQTPCLADKYQRVSLTIRLPAETETRIWSHGAGNPQVVLNWNGAECPHRLLWTSGLLRWFDVRPGSLSLHLGRGPAGREAAPLEQPAERITCNQKQRLIKRKVDKKMAAGWKC